MIGEEAVQGYIFRDQGDSTITFMALNRSFFTSFSIECELKFEPKLVIGLSSCEVSTRTKQKKGPIVWERSTKERDRERVARKKKQT